jgi:MYXO-CTERM domain-containing protein
MSTPIDHFTSSGLEFRAGGEGQDACGGDSGGPAFIKLESGEHRLAGVTSRGVRPCGTGDSVYGVPYPILTWLREETGADLLPAACPDGDCLKTAQPDEGCDCRTNGDIGALALVFMLALGRRRRRIARA